MGKRVKKRKSPTNARQSRWETRQLAAEGRPGTGSQLKQKLFLFAVYVCECLQHFHPAQESQSTAGSNREQGKVTNIKQTVKLQTKVRGEHFSHAINQDRREMVIVWCQRIHLNPSGSIVPTCMVELICVFLHLCVVGQSAQHLLHYKNKSVRFWKYKNRTSCKSLCNPMQ